MQLIRSFLRAEEGVTATEYGILAALIGVIALLSVEFLGEEIDQTFNTLEDFVAHGNAGGMDDDS